jgi:hypothetical protein
MRQAAVIMAVVLTLIFLYWTVDYLRRRAGR